MKVGICDDNQKDQKHLAAVLAAAMHPCDLLECFSHGAGCLESHYRKPFDILFLDIGMPHLSGIDVARELRSSSSATAIIFVTVHRDYAKESYEVNAFSYLTKPYTKDSILCTYQNACQNRKSRSKALAVQAGYHTFFVPLPDIIYGETLRGRLYLHTRQQILETRMTLQELNVHLQRLHKYSFYRLHHSYLVNLDYVYSIQNRFVLLADGTRVPIGKTKKISDLKAAILAWQSAKP